ncbi:MAG: ABC transporter ATP-binding protein [Anaerolineae bacterium]|nr:ABC transporter ATP-binding protein [Anaerolineae bacterium]
MAQLAIRVEGIGKKYRIGVFQDTQRDMAKSLANTFVEPARRAANILRGREEGATGLSEIFWALQDISFEVDFGEAVGIIGRNGAGKSTLLKILSRITKPTTGRVELYKQFSSLLEVGTGFHPELTGRENVFLNGAILGMSRAEVMRKYDEIVDFSGVEEFIDTPIKHYSSGMRVRLGFAVAAHMEPEILMVDEVLAVGDVEFQRKCLGKMSDVTSEGRTVLFVSHNMATISSLCPRCILLNAGQIEMDGSTDEVIAQYLGGAAAGGGEVSWAEGYADPEIDEIKINRIRLSNSTGQSTDLLDVRHPFTAEIDYELLQSLVSFRVSIHIANSEGVVIIHSHDVDNPDLAGMRQPGHYTSSCTIPGNLLSPGRYFLSVTSDIQHVKVLTQQHNILSFHISDTGAFGSDVGGRRLGVIRPVLDWTQTHES